MQLSEFNALSADRAAELVGVWANVPGWVTAIVEGRPYPDLDALAVAARQAAAGWQADELDAALADHPRIGQRVETSGAQAEASRREQASMATADDAVSTAMAAGNAAYEQRFGRVFLIRAAGRGPQEMLDELHRRLGNDAEAETAEAVGQLTEIALLRLRTAITDDRAQIG